LYSKGPIPWRLLAYLLKLSPEIARVRAVMRKRLMDEPRIKANEKILESMLLTLASGGYVTLSPEPPRPTEGEPSRPQDGQQPYQAILGEPTPALDRLLVFRSVHPLYGAFLIDQFGLADETERLQALESALEMPRRLLRYVRPPRMEDMP